MSVGYQSFYQAQLTAGISDTDLSIPVDVVPTVDEGFLVIESTVANKREIIYFTSKTASTVECPSGAGNGRGYDGTTAVSHLQGSAVIMAPVGAMFSELREQFTTTPQGWTSLVQNISTVTANGNRSYTLGFDASVSSILSDGMRLRTTRTSAATTNAFSLDGANDYYNDTTVAGMTFTDDFSVSAWVYPTAYGGTTIVSRYNGTSGWMFLINTDGTVSLRGYNAGAANLSRVDSYQSVPLNRWTHVSAQLDMSTFTATTTTSYVMIDCVNVPAVVSRTGTNPTALIQAGNLEVGSFNAGASPFAGYIDQVAIYSAKVTQATHLAAAHQGLTGSETSLISAYANGSVTDLNTTNANNLTAQNGATTVASAPWGNRGTSSTLDYALVMAVSTTNVTVQVPEGCTIPTSGGVSAVAYSTQANPYGFVSDKGRWEVSSMYRVQTTVNSTTTYTTFANLDSHRIVIPIGTWKIQAKLPTYNAATAGISVEFNLTDDTSIVGVAFGAYDKDYSLVARNSSLVVAVNTFVNSLLEVYRTLSTATTFKLYNAQSTGTTAAGLDGDDQDFSFRAIPSNL
jgi:hypothetical protein